jgi:hypothetical protein
MFEHVVIYLQIELTSLVLISIDCLGRSKYNCHTITTMTDPFNNKTADKTAQKMPKKSSSASIQLTFIWREAYENGLDKKEHKHFNFNKNPVINQVYLTQTPYIKYHDRKHMLYV